MSRLQTELNNLYWTLFNDINKGIATTIDDTTKTQILNLTVSMQSLSDRISKIETYLDTLSQTYKIVDNKL